MARAYGYYVNLDERGSFYADVRDVDGKTIFEVRAEGRDPDLVEDGFMSDRHDASGLEEHLRDLQVIGENDRILPSGEFERAPFIERSGSMISEDVLADRIAEMGAQDAGAGPQTLVTWLYRDGSNYKRTGHAILDGAATPDLVRRLALATPAGDLVIGGFPSSDTCMRAGRDMGREMMRFASRRNGRAYGLLICVDLETGDVVSEDMP